MHIFDNLTKFVNKLKQRQTFIILLIFQCLVLGFILIFCSIKYEVSDDFMIELVLSGGFTGDIDWHLMFSNPFLGLILYPFYLINRTISWYFVFQLFICFVSFLSVSWVFSFKENKLAGIALTVIITVFSVGDLYIIPQFTKTAAIAILAGSLLFLDGIFREGKAVPVILGCTLTIFGTFLRFDVVYSVGLAVCISAIVFLIRFLINKRGKTVTALKKISFCFLLIGIIFALNIGGEVLFRANPEYDHYKEYSHARSLIVDYEYVDYSVCSNELEEIGISENDYYMLIKWNFGDDEKFDLDTMKQIAEILNKHRNKNKITINNIIWHINERNVPKLPIARCILLLVVICLFINWRKIWLPLLCTLVCILYFILFYYLGRNVYRVEFTFLLSAVVVIAWYIDSAMKSSSELIKDFILCLVCFATIIYMGKKWMPKEGTSSDGAACRDNIYNYLYYSWDYKPQKFSVYIPYGKPYEAFTAMVNDNPDNVYLFEFTTTIQTYYYNFSPFASGANVFPKNVLWIGGVDSRFPATKKWLDAHGYSCTLKALLAENVYYVGNRHSEYFLTYYHENGYRYATKELIDIIDGYEIYKFSDNILTEKD